MKQFYSFVPAFLFSAGIVFYISDFSSSPAKSISKDVNSSARETEDAADFAQYELHRLRDPETGRIPDNIRQKELEYASTLPGFISPFAKGFHLDSANNLNWQSRGPWNVGGRTRAFAIDAANSNKLLAGSTSGGMWTSTNGGTSWTQTWGIAHQSISCIAQDTRVGKTNTWYVGTGEGYGQSAGASGAYYLGNGMYKSTDGGQTWNSLPATAANAPQTFNSIWDLIWNTAINPSDTTANGVVYAAVYNAIYKSINGGTSWTITKGTGLTAPYSYFTDVAVSDSGVVYATFSSDGGASEKGIWRSPDGINWTNITPTNFPTTFGRIKIGISPSDQNQVYFWAGTTTGFGTPDTNFLGQVEWNSLWKYHYNATTPKWYDLSANLPTTGGVNDKQNVQGGYDMLVKFKPNDTAVVFLGGTNLYRSNDGFFSPNNTKLIGGYKQGSVPPNTAKYLNHHPDQHEIVFDMANNILYSSNDGGVYKSANFMADTVAWTPMNNGYLTSMFYTVALDHASTSANDSTIIGGLQDNNSWFVNSNNPQKIWSPVFFGDGSYCAVANNKLNYYFSIQNGKMQKMQLDAAGNVLARRRIDPIGGKGYQFVNPYILDPNNNNIMYLAGGKNLWRNDNLNSIPLQNPSLPGGWDSISTGWTMFPDTVPTAGATITALAVSTNPANRLYYGTSSKNVYRVDNANTGTPTAVDITGAAFPNGANVSCIAIDPTDSRKVIVAFSNYNVYSIFYTTNADSIAPTWKLVAGNLEQNSNLTGAGNGPSVRWVSIMPVVNGTVFLAATSTGMYATDTLVDASTLWAQQGAATIGNAICDMIDFRTTDGLVAVATHSHGIYTTNITSKGDVAAVLNVQNASLTFDVYPNPSNGKFLIQMNNVQLTIDNYQLSIYNVRGEKAYSSTINSQSSIINLDVPNGIYYCVIKSDKALETRKIVIVK
jgi:hypothetical protein